MGNVSAVKQDWPMEMSDGAAGEHSKDIRLNFCEISFWNISWRKSEEQLPSGYYICGPLLTLVIIAGFLGNITCIKVLLSMRRRAAIAINIYLIVLAGWDLTLVVASFFLYNIVVLVNGYRPVFGDYVRSYPTLFTLANASHTASIWCVVAMASERYYALCYPLRHRRASLDHATRARRALISISLLALLISVPKFFEVQFGQCSDPMTRSDVIYVTSSKLRRNQAYSIIYITIGGLLFHSLAPFFILVILSIRVIIEVRRGAVTRRQISVKRNEKLKTSASTVSVRRVKMETSASTAAIADGGSRRCRRNPSGASSSSSTAGHNKVNEMLPLAVVAKFFICHSLPTVLDIFERLMSEEDFEGPLVDLMVDISNFLVVLNSSVNLGLYTACSIHFRRRVIGMIRKIWICGGGGGGRDNWENEGKEENDMDSWRYSTLTGSEKKHNDNECAAELLPNKE